jgi:hypothetical protein
MTRAATAYLRLDQLKGDPAGRAREGQLRRVTLADHAVDYRLIRARRRTIGMEVDLEGLTVRAPRWVTLSEIEAALDLCVNTGQPQLLPLFLQMSDTSKQVFFNGIQRHVESLVTKDFT